MDIEWLLKLIVIYVHMAFLKGRVCTNNKIIGTEKSKDLPNKVDSDSKTSFMIRDPKYIVPCCGVITKWTVFIMKSGTIHFQVWRDLGTGFYTFIGENLATYHPGEEENYYTVTVDEDHEIPVKEGDFIGWYTSGKSMPGYTNQRKGFGALSASLKKGFQVGDAVDWSKGKVSSPRSYALTATVAKSNQPKFKNLDTDIEINDDLKIGTDIYTLTFVGYEPGFVPYNVVVTMETTTEYFVYNSTSNKIYLNKQPPVGKTVLELLAKDHCETSTKGKLKISIKSRTPRITNLPSSTFIREDLHRIEVLLKELNVTFRENVMCVILKVNPPKTASLFTIKAIPGKDFVFGVYLKSSADLDHDKNDLYIITVKCSEGKVSDIEDLSVYVESNKAPVFANIPGSFHVDAKTAKVADSLYQVNATDNEDDVIRHRLVCDNVQPCPFGITKDGTVFLQQSLNRTIAKIIFLNVTIEDNFNVVGPSILIANITNFNRPPYIEDITNVVVTLHENSPEGMILYEVSAHDPDDGDVITFSLEVKPSRMREYFAINENSGIITALSPVNFESVKFKVAKLIVSVSDGKDESSSFLKVGLVDENEPPQFVFGSYTMRIPEGKPSQKNDLRVKAKDFDKASSISFTMACENDSETFQINENTGVVSQVRHVDVDDLGVSDLIIECNISARDVGGLTSFAPLTIFIHDINDNPPNFPKTSYTFVVSNYVPVYTVIGNVGATDRDTSPENNEIFYSINDDLDDFIIDENGTIYMMMDISGIPFGSVFKYNVTAEDKDKLSDWVPVTIVIIYNLDPELMASGSKFLSYPENVVWTVSAVYLAFIAVGLVVFLITYYLRCSIKRKMQIRDSRSSRMSVSSIMSSKLYTNVFNKHANRDDLIISPIPNMQRDFVPRTTLPQRRSGARCQKQNISKISNEDRSGPADISKQENTDNVERSEKESTDKARINKANNTDDVKPMNLSVVNLPYESSPYTRVRSVERNSFVSELAPSPSISTSKLNFGSKRSSSAFYPSGSGSSWKPWSVDDFREK